MNQTHIHLLITHLPIFGSILGAVVLMYGLWSKSNETKIAAYLVFIISSVGAGISYLTGEAAEETVEHLPGVVENMIEQHEQAALFAIIILTVLGLTSIMGIIFTIKKSPVTTVIAKIILFISLLSFSVVARTGYLGGHIRHTEIHDALDNNIEHHREY